MLVPPFYIRCSLIEWKRFLWHLQLGASTCISKDYCEKNWIQKVLASKIGRKIRAYRWCSGALRLSTSFGFFINTVEWIIKKRPMLCLDLACTNRRVRSFESLHSNRSRVSVLWWGRRKLCSSKLFSSEPWYMVRWLWNHNARLLSFWTAEVSSILVGRQSLVKNFAVKWEHMLLQMWNFLLKWDNLCDELLSLPPHPNRQITITTSLFPVQTLHSYGRLFHYLQNKHLQCSSNTRWGHFGPIHGAYLGCKICRYILRCAWIRGLSKCLLKTHSECFLIMQPGLQVYHLHRSKMKKLETIIYSIFRLGKSKMYQNTM